MRVKNLPKEIKLMLGDPLICDRKVRSIKEYTSMCSIELAKSAARKLGFMCSSSIYNLPSALVSDVAFFLRQHIGVTNLTWLHIDPMYKNLIKGVVLSEGTNESPAYLILFK
jgi:hypothetical protein